MEKSKEIKQVNKEIKLLYKKSKGLLGAKKKIIPMKQPIGILKRRNSTNTFHEGLTGDTFTFKRSDGKEGTINLNAKFLETFSYGQDSFRGYTLHEDSAYPIGHEDILVYADMQKQAIDKLQGEELKLLTANTKAKFEGYGTILKWIVAIILAVAVYKIMMPTGTTPTQATGIAQQVIQNVTERVTIIK